MITMPTDKIFIILKYSKVFTREPVSTKNLSNLWHTWSATNIILLERLYCISFKNHYLRRYRFRNRMRSFEGTNSFILLIKRQTMKKIIHFIKFKNFQLASAITSLHRRQIKGIKHVQNHFIFPLGFHKIKVFFVK